MPSLPLDNQSLPESFVQDKDDRPQVPHDAFSDEVPVVSLAGIDDAGEGRINARKKIVEACEKWGVFQAVDHGVDQGLVDEMVRLSKEFFALPAQEKLEVAMSGDRRGGYLVSSTHQVYMHTSIITYINADRSVYVFIIIIILSYYLVL